MITVDLQGLTTLLQKLEDIGEAGDQVVLETITDIVLDTHQFAVDGIAGGGKSGETYVKSKPKRTHKASAPGQYPATDTGRLLTSVRVSGLELPTLGNLSGAVGTNVRYGPYLEFGTSRMAARPWLLPSFERAKVGVEADLRRRFEAKT